MIAVDEKDDEFPLALTGFLAGLYFRTRQFPISEIEAQHSTTSSKVPKRILKDLMVLAARGGTDFDLLDK